MKKSLFFITVISFSYLSFSSAVFAGSCRGSCVNDVAGACPTGTRPELGSGLCDSSGQVCCEPTSTAPASNSTGSTGGSVSTNFQSPFGAQNELGSLLAGILARLQSYVGYLALVFLVLGGVLYAASAGQEKMISAAKACITAAIIGFVIILAAPTILTEIKNITGMPSITQPDSIRSIQAMAMAVLKLLLSIVGSLGIIGLVISGILYVTAAMNAGQAESAKKAMTYSIIGVAVAALSLIILQQITTLITG